MWYQKIIASLHGEQIVNDSKTPSGTVHVGSLRGVLIHDVIFRALLANKFNAKYTFGIDDFDPLDGLPHDAPSWLEKYMGHPLCNVPAPSESTASDIANHYIVDFLEIFKELGVNAEIYHMRDVYRSGKFNQAIGTILKNSDKVRQIYQEVSNSIRPDNWHPFQVICENCGSLGTTEVSSFDGEKVSYHCKPDLVSWATGCNHQGKVSPFDGNGKLPWKLEWAAKWAVLGITIEGAGKDHCTKGGSHDVAAACLRQIFNLEPPLNIPYEFFLVSGAKMSSSKGVGTSARDMANLLPPEMLRFLMTRTAPKKTVNFSTDLEYMVKLYNEYDRLNQNSQDSNNEQMLQMLEVEPRQHSYHPVGFQVLTALLQLPHLNVEEEVNKRSDGDKNALKKRISSAKYWLDNFISERGRVVLQTSLPHSVNELSESQRAFLSILANLIPDQSVDEDEYQRIIFTAARTTPLPQPKAFQAMYRALLDKDQGPKGGALFSYLKPDFLKDIFGQSKYSKEKFFQQSAVSEDKAKDFLERQEIAETTSKLTSLSNGHFVETTLTLTNSRQHLLRLEFADIESAENFLNKYSK